MNITNKYIKYISIFLVLLGFASITFADSGSVTTSSLSVLNNTDKNFFTQALNVINGLLSVFYGPFFKQLIEGFLSNFGILSVTNQTVITLFSILLTILIIYVYMFTSPKSLGGRGEKEENSDEDSYLDYNNNGNYNNYNRNYNNYNNYNDYNDLEETEGLEGLEGQRITSLLGVLKNAIIIAREKGKNMTREIIVVIGIIFVLILLNIGLSSSVGFQSVISFDKGLPGLIFNIYLVFVFVLGVIFSTKFLLIDKIIKSANNNKDDTFSILFVGGIMLIIILTTLQFSSWLFNYFGLTNYSKAKTNIDITNTNTNTNTINSNNFQNVDLNSLLK